MPKLTVVFTGSPTERYNPDSGGIQLAELMFCESKVWPGWNKKVIVRGHEKIKSSSDNVNLIEIYSEDLRLGGLADSVPFSLKASAIIDELCEKGEDCIHFTSLIPATIYFDHPIHDYLKNNKRVIKSKFFYTIHNYHYGVSDKPEDVFVNYPEEWKYLHEAENRVINHVDKVFVPCRRYVDVLSKKFDREISYVPNTVGDLNKYRISTRTSHEYKILLTLSRLEQVKNLEGLLRAFKVAQTHDKKIRLIIGGEGSLLSSLKSICAQSNLRCSQNPCLMNKKSLYSRLDKFDVIFVGKVEGNDKRFLFEFCDCVALFSFREICSLFGLEAIAYGKRILASKIPGWQDYKDCGCDIMLCNPYKIKEMADTILEGTVNIKEKSYTISKKNKEIYQKYYSPEIVSTIRYSLYENSLRSNL